MPDSPLRRLARALERRHLAACAAAVADRRVAQYPALAAEARQLGRPDVGAYLDGLATGPARKSPDD